MTLIGDVQNLSKDVKALGARLDKLSELTARHEEQISGGRGLQKAVEELSEKITSMTGAIRMVGIGIVLSAVGFGVTVLTVFGA
jgi:hypothetical protein